jgi:hypothetical protein
VTFVTPLGLSAQCRKTAASSEFPRGYGCYHSRVRIAALLLLGFSLTGVAEPGPGLARFERVLAARDATQLSNPERRPMFALQELARVYEKEFPDLEKLRLGVKELEDRLGKANDWKAHIKYAEDLGVPEPAVKWIREQHASAVVELDGYLKKNPNLVRDWRKAVAKIPWPDPQTDRELVLKRMTDYTEKLLTDEWDMKDLQEGHHEFRRKIRRLAIVSQAMSDLFQLDDNLKTRFDPILTDPASRGEFAELPPATHQSEVPIFLLRSLYYEINRALVLLGDSKDLGEAADEWLPEALEKSGVAKSHKEALRLAAEYVKKHPKYEVPWKTASKVYRRFRADDRRYSKKYNRGVVAALNYLFMAQAGWTAADCNRRWRQLK